MNEAQDRGALQLLARARAWLEEDPDPATRAELAALIERGETAEIADRFSGTLEFGTAGLRGALGAGPNRMNRVVVTRTAAGLAAYVVEHGGGAVVIGYDARYNSDVFARDTAEVMTGAGLPAMVLPRPLPTPVLAYAIRALGCAAGVMVTASHNPPQDNGYKVYLGDGSQIVPPADAEIAARIAAVGPPASVPRGDDWVTLDDRIVDDYVHRVAALVPPASARTVTAVYSAMHGVGGDVVLATMRAAGYAEPVRVEAQFEPDPDFPTVAFPNPEEPGAIDLALDAAEASNADLVIANDPDADRCAAAVRERNGRWRMLRGDEVGALLGAHVLRRGARGTFANSIVSSSLLGKICADHNVQHVETLTGFKWIARVDGLSYGYEEALGYCVDPAAVRDKDGISAALLMLELAATVKAQGRTLLDELDDLARAYGLHQTDQLSVRVEDISVIANVMARLRANPPIELAGAAVTSAEDLERGAGGLPPTDGLRYRLDDGSRIVVRPSGTEPKLKCYLEVVVAVAEGDVAAAHTVARARLDRLKQDLAVAAGLT
ncbi:MAG: phospho-sugar mutase [Candidatus Nanopelagicales bacterium]